MLLRVQAPTRIDLAGATLDIYPLYLFEGGGLTLNAAIDLYSEVELEEQSEDRIRIEASDLGLVLEGSDLEALRCSDLWRREDCRQVGRGVPRPAGGRW